MIDIKYKSMNPLLSSLGRRLQEDEGFQYKMYGLLEVGGFNNKYFFPTKVTNLLFLKFCYLRFSFGDFTIDLRNLLKEIVLRRFNIVPFGRTILRCRGDGLNLGLVPCSLLN